MKAATAATGSLSPMDSAGGTAPPVAEDAFGEVAGPGRGSLSKADKAAPARGASKKHPLRGGRQPQQLDPRYGARNVDRQWFEQFNNWVTRMTMFRLQFSQGGV